MGGSSRTLDKRQGEVMPFYSQNTTAEVEPDKEVARRPNSRSRRSGEVGPRDHKNARWGAILLGCFECTPPPLR